MLSNENKPKSKLSLKFQVGAVVFLLLFLTTSILIIFFHVLVTTHSFETALNHANIIRTNENTLTFLKNSVVQILSSSLLWLLLAIALIDIVTAYIMAMWIGKPMEALLQDLKTAYKQGLPYKSFEDKKFKEIKEISDVVSDMTTKYIDAIELQNLFIQDISHELKTPLAAQKSSGELIKMNKDPNMEDYRYFFQTSQIMNKRMIDLVNQLTISNKTEVELYDDENFNFSTLVKDIIKIHMSEIESKKLKVHFDIEKDIHIKGSAKYITIAVSNLLDNAIKYSDKENGVIEINLKRKRGNIFLEIKDQGIGISEANLKNVFDRFYRGENAQDKNGSGLGLSIARKIINAHGGKIIMKSKLDLGSQVSVIF